jgi:hypothetical protein
MNKYLVYGLVFLAGVVLADQARKLPGVSMLPKL